MEQDKATNLGNPYDLFFAYLDIVKTDNTFSDPQAKWFLGKLEKSFKLSTKIDPDAALPKRGALGQKSQMDVVELVTPIVKHFLGKNEFSIAAFLLDRLYLIYTVDYPNIELQAKVAKMGFILAESFFRSGYFDVALFNRAYLAYPFASKEAYEVAAKGQILADYCANSGNFDAANALLRACFAAYPLGSREKQNVLDKQRRINAMKQLTASNQSTMQLPEIFGRKLLRIQRLLSQTQIIN